jgi:phage N-6-adenine-methyltransferase
MGSLVIKDDSHLALEMSRIGNAIEVCSDWAEANKLQAKAAAIAAAAKQVKAGQLVVNNANKLLLRCKARRGEMTASVPRVQGRRDDTSCNVARSPDTEDLGLDRKERLRIEQLAEMKESGELDEYFEECDESMTPISTNGAINWAKKKASRATDDPDYDGDEWYTPSKYVESARKVLGSIDLDPASNERAQQTVAAGRFYTKEDDGLSKSWAGNVWMNPPYSFPLVQQFAAKLVSSYSAGDVIGGIMLVNNCTDAGWFHDAWDVADAVCFTKGRIKFYNNSGSFFATRQGQAFFYFGKDPGSFAAEFSKYGKVVKQWET